jgi:8-oxo-dGTP pyrophosphatase MutT (NUDIX family)
MNTPARLAVATVPARPAATTLIVRDGPSGLDVLMVKRSMQASFMPGAYVFPGGAVDAADGAAPSLAACDEPADMLLQRIDSVTGVGDQAAAFAVAALRECFEECGLWLGAHAAAAVDWTTLRARLHAGAALHDLATDAGAQLHTGGLQPWAHWVTPAGVPKRFDTLFFVALAPPGQSPSVDAGETTTLEWVHPPAALAAQARGEFQMEFATVAVMRTLEGHAAQPAQALLDHAASLRHIPAVQPRLLLNEQGHIRGALLPGQPGYDTAGVPA